MSRNSLTIMKRYRNDKNFKKSVIEYNKNWAKNNPKKRKIISRRYREKIKMRVLQHYSFSIPKCANCSIGDIRLLVIDHIKNDGRILRRKNRSFAGTNFYMYLIKNGFPSGYQVLCHNCNYLKELEFRQKK